jgi:SAM-dependent methyltransferase
MSAAYKKSIRETLGRDPVHPFPARMAPGIALDIIASEENSIRILDPMMGSGTVLAVARACGHMAIGVDIDPLAILIGKVWTTAIDGDGARSKAVEVLDRARQRFAVLSSGNAYPVNSDESTKRFIRYWFDDYARRQLTALSESIGRVHDERTRNVLWCAFSRLIIAKQAGASLAMDLSHSRPHKTFARSPIKPFNKFLVSVEQVVANCIDFGDKARGPAARISLGDARRLSVPSGSIDLVLTSPPYLNAIDYIRCSKFSLVWMGYGVDNLSSIRAESVGTERSDEDAHRSEMVQKVVRDLKLRPALSPHKESVLSHYILDMQKTVKETSRVLKKGGRAVFVVGENTVRGTFIPNAKMIAAVAALSGLELRERKTRILPANRRYLPPPTVTKSPDALDARMRREVVLSFSK